MDRWTDAWTEGQMSTQWPGNSPHKKDFRMQIRNQSMSRTPTYKVGDASLNVGYVHYTDSQRNIQGELIWHEFLSLELELAAPSGTTQSRMKWPHAGTAWPFGHLASQGNWKEDGIQDRHLQSENFQHGLLISQTRRGAKNQRSCLPRQHVRATLSNLAISGPTACR